MPDIKEHIAYLSQEIGARPAGTEEEQQAILWHNGLYGPFKYEIQGNETLLYMILHFADLWSSRVTEEEECNE